MHALFFEVLPVPGHLPNYFEHVERLRPVLARHDGLTFLQRYTSLSDPDRLLSHQLWRDEAAIIAWRRDPAHRVSQSAGRKVHFQDYRIRVGIEALRLDPNRAITRDAPVEAGALVVVAHRSAASAARDFEGYESVTEAGRFITLADAQTEDAAFAMLSALAEDPQVTQASAFRTLRDYGMTDRAQAPDVTPE